MTRPLKPYLCITCKEDNPKMFTGTDRSYCYKHRTNRAGKGAIIKEHKCDCGETDPNNFYGVAKSICKDCTKKRMKENRENSSSPKKSHKVKVVFRIMPIKEAESKEAEKRAKKLIKAKEAIQEAQAREYGEALYKVRKLIGPGLNQIHPNSIDFSLFDSYAEDYGERLIEYLDDLIDKKRDVKLQEDCLAVDDVPYDNIHPNKYSNEEKESNELMKDSDRFKSKEVGKFVKSEEPNLAQQGLQSILSYCNPPTYVEKPKKEIIRGVGVYSQGRWEDRSDWDQQDWANAGYTHPTGGVGYSESRGHFLM